MLWAIFVLSVLVAYGVTKLSIVVSMRHGVLDLPNARSSHSLPVPRMGGIGILSGFFLSIGVLEVLGRLHFAECIPFSREIWVILLAAAGMAATGLIDDFYHLKPGEKFLMQFVVAAGVVAFGIRLEIVAIPSWRILELGVISFPLTILWLTGFSNVCNFMDGINGLAAGTGAVYGAFFFLFAWMQGNPGLVAIAVLSSGSCLGFMVHNFPEARTFMGDGGSLFLGMISSLLVVRLAQQSPNPASLVALLLVCSVYLYDSTFTLLRRLRHGENIFRAHRSHLYQRLVMAGLPHTTTTYWYIFMHALMGCLALLYIHGPESIRLWVLGFASIIFLAFTLGVLQFENRAAKSKAEGA